MTTLTLADLHRRLQDLPLEALVESDLVEAAAAHASEGCSACARALVNARELTSRLALANAAAPNVELRDRLLASARGRRPASAEASSSPPRVRVLDPSAVVAHRHVAGADEAARVAEIDALAAGAEVTDDPAHRLLAELAPFISLPVLFVNVVRGDRVSYRVQRGLPDVFAGFRELRREMSYCTHCVSMNAPLVVEDARDDAFFRGSPMVTRFHCLAYLGVPLATSRGVAVGSLCALGFEPQRHRPAEVALLEHYAPVVVETLEAPRHPISKVRGDDGLYVAEWFERLLAIVAELAPNPTLLRASADAAKGLLARAAPGDVAGHLASGEIGLLAASGAAARSA